MEVFNLRSGSYGATQKAQSRSTKGAPFSFDPSDAKPSKFLEGKSASKASSLPEKLLMKVTEISMQQQLVQLQEELKIAKEERAQALRELAEVKKELPHQKTRDEISQQSEKVIEMLEVEAEKAKESEREMLESLILQTKELEQTKISLEEAKLEIRSLDVSIRGFEHSHLEKKGASISVDTQEVIGVVRNELKLAMEAEGKSKKAMDELAIALIEVTTEANQVKDKLSSTESSLQKFEAEAERLSSLLNITEEKYRAAVEESEQVKIDFEESAAAWNRKEDGFINCMKASQEEIDKAKEENNRLIDSQRLSREDNSKLRDILKHAVNEATMVKETLEIVRKENHRLNDLLSEKNNALLSIRQEYECLKVSEVAALDSVKELKNLLATSSVDSGGISGSLVTESMRQPNGRRDENEARGGESLAKFASDHWKNENSRARNGRRHSIGEAGRLKGFVPDTEGSMDGKHRIFASTVSKVPSSLLSDATGSVNLDDFDQLNRNQLAEMDYNGSSPMKEKKKKPPMIRRFGDMLRRRSFHR